MRKLFREHPESHGETYLEHMSHALMFSARMLVSGSACFVHAFLPFVFKTTASDGLVKMVRVYVDRVPHDKRFMED